MNRLIAILLILWPARAFAQVATLRVTVIDPTGAVIVGARVRLTPASGQATATVLVHGRTR